MAPVTSDLLDTTRDKLKMELVASMTKPTTTPTTEVSQENGKAPTAAAMKKKRDEAAKEKVAVLNQVAKHPQDALATLQQKSHKLPLRLVNAHITCNICKGYLIDATTLVECLHSCKYPLYVAHYCRRQSSQYNSRPDRISIQQFNAAAASPYLPADEQLDCKGDE